MLARVSNIETWRQWQYWRPRHDNDVELTLEEVVARITTDTPTTAMRAGTAFHGALETAGEGDLDVIRADGFTFVMPDAEIALPPIREMRVSKRYGDLVVSGKADAVVGNGVIDHKTTSKVDFDRYLTGCQWRFYLDMFGASTFRWNVFRIHERAREPGVYDVAAPEVLTTYWYPGLSEDCAELAAEYLDFAEAHLPADFNPLAGEYDPDADDDGGDE